MKKFSWILIFVVTVFIIIPIVLVLKESFLGKRPFTEKEYKDAVQVLLEKIPEEQKRVLLNEWNEQIPETQRIDVYAKSLKILTGKEVDPKQVTFDDVEKKVQQLKESERRIFNQTLLLEYAYQKRSVFIFKIKPFITAGEFNDLRGGYKKIWTIKHYQEFFSTDYLWGSFTRSIKVATVSTIFIVILAYVFSFTITRTT